MIPVLFITLDTVYVDDGILRCVESGDSVCVESYSLYNRAVEFIRQFRYDSSTIYLMHSIDVLKDRNLPYWKAYLYGLLYMSATEEWKLIKSNPVRRDSLRRFMEEGWNLSWELDSTMGLYTRCSHNYAEIAMYTGNVEEKHIHRPLKLSDRVYMFRGKKPVSTMYEIPLFGKSFSEYVPFICYINNEDAYYPYVKKWFRDSTYDFHHKVLGAIRLAEIYVDRGMINTARYYTRWLSSVADTSRKCNAICRMVVYNFLGDFYMFKDYDFIRREYYNKKAMSILDSLNLIDTWFYGVIYNNYGSMSRDPHEGLIALRNAYEYNLKYYGKSNGLANIMANMYRRFLELKQYDSAEVYINRIVDIREKVRGENDIYTFMDKLGMSQFYFRRGDTIRARQLARQAINKFHESSIYWPWPEWRKKYYLLRAYEIYGNRKKVIELSKDMLNSREISPFYKFTHELYLANLYAEAGDSISAIRYVRSVFDSLPYAVDGMSRSLRMLFYRRLMRYWGSLVSHFLKWDPGDLVLYSEMLKARMLAEERNYMSDPVVDSLIRLLNMKIAEGASDDELLEIEVRISDRIEELSSMAVRNGPVEIPEDVAFLGYLVMDSLLLEYMVSQRDTAVFVQNISGDSLEFLVNSLNENPDDGVVSITLYGLLLKPFDSLLKDYEHVAISRHGILNYLNYSILNDGHRYVVEKPYSIYYTLSLYTLDSPCRVEGRVFAIGRDDYGNNPVVMRSGLGNLAYAEREARSVSDIMGGDYLVGDSLQEKKLYEIPIEDYEVFHVATHALVDTIPEIIIGPQRDTSLWNNNIMTIYEIMARLRSGKMVVLSGCRTGYGRIINDWEGVNNLLRAFIYTGARCVITTSWDVNDLASYAFMVTFYRFLKSGETADMALKDAQVHMLRNTGLDSPRFWGPFALTVFRR